MTQQELALEAHVSISSIQRWEAGKLPPLQQLLYLASILEVDPQELIADREILEQETGSLRRLREALAAEAESLIAALRAYRSELEREIGPPARRSPPAPTGLGQSQGRAARASGTSGR